jgi:hypothetical protein
MKRSIALGSLLGLVLLGSACGAGAELQSASTANSLPPATQPETNETARTDDVTATASPGLDVTVDDSGVSVDADGVDVTLDGSGVDVNLDADLDADLDDSVVDTESTQPPDTTNTEPSDDDTMDGLIFSGDDQQIDADCAGGAATVSGDWNTIILSGTCEKVEVLGSDNTISVETVSTLSVAGYWNSIDASMVGVITVNGGDNTITWGAGINGGTPKVTAVDDYNVITRAR